MCCVRETDRPGSKGVNHHVCSFKSQNSWKKLVSDVFLGGLFNFFGVLSLDGNVWDMDPDL